jgi:hypothetical protein
LNLEELLTVRMPANRSCIRHSLTALTGGGGVWFWDGEDTEPQTTSITLFSNSAAYGFDFATPLVHIAVTSAAVVRSTVQIASAGVTIRPSFVVRAFDYYWQLVVTSTAVCSVTPASMLAGNLAHVFVRGVANFSTLSLRSPPGTFLLTISTDGGVSTSQNVTIGGCAAGEARAPAPDLQCRPCDAGSFLNYSTSLCEKCHPGRFSSKARSTACTVVSLHVCCQGA